MITAKVRKGNQLEKLLQRVKQLNGENVKVGHFKRQGLHNSGMTYPQLMAIHHSGNPEKNLPARPVLDILFFRNRRLTDTAIKLAFKQWGRRKITNSSNAELLDDLGKYFRSAEKEIFGSSALAPNAVPPKDSNNPLILKGDLRSKVAYRTSIDKQIKEG